MDVIIVPLPADKFESWHRCLEAVARERRFIATLEARPLEQMLPGLTKLHSLGDAMFVALDAGQVVGSCEISPSHRPISAHVGGLGMALLPDYRGQGLGTRLLAATLAPAKRRFHRIELEVFADNRRAIALYERAGFQHEGVKIDAARIDGRTLNIVQMAMVAPWGVTVPDSGEHR